MSAAWSAGLTGLSGLVAPAFCLTCRRDLLPPRRPPGGWAPGVPGLERLLCRPCRDRLELVVGACRACGRALGPHPAEEARCEACRSVPKGHVTTTTALLRYRGGGRRVLHRLKYSGREVLAEPLGRALAERIRRVRPEVAARPDLVVVPVPLHLVRRWGRGFNQAERIAQATAAALGRPCRSALRRRRATPPLFGVEPADRADLLAGAFRARRRHVAGRPVLLVDDIRTSGATLRDAARALVAAGAARVDAAVAAR